MQLGSRAGRGSAAGENESGQLGDGTSDYRMTPSPVVGLTRLVDRGIKLEAEGWAPRIGSSHRTAER